MRLRRPALRVLFNLRLHGSYDHSGWPKFCGTSFSCPKPYEGRSWRGWCAGASMHRRSPSSRASPGPREPPQKSAAPFRERSNPVIANHPSSGLLRGDRKTPLGAFARLLHLHGRRLPSSMTLLRSVTIDSASDREARASYLDVELATDRYPESEKPQLTQSTRRPLLRIECRGLRRIGDDASHQGSCCWKARREGEKTSKAA